MVLISDDNNNEIRGIPVKKAPLCSNLPLKVGGGIYNIRDFGHQILAQNNVFERVLDHFRAADENVGRLQPPPKTLENIFTRFRH